jgi:hypothetical protein
VIRIRSIVTLVMLALWLPVTLHCELERIPGLEFLRCAADTDQSDCRDTGCCGVEKSQYKVGQSRLAIPPPVFLPLSPAPLLNVADALTDRVSAGILTTAPPELPKCWQFVFRTASPPRAPSFAS